MNNNLAIERYSSEFVKRGLSLANQVQDQKNKSSTSIHFHETEENYDLLIRSGIKSLNSNSFRQALEYFRKALIISEISSANKTSCYFLIAFTQLGLKQYLEVADTLNKAIQENQKYFQIWEIVNDTLLTRVEQATIKVNAISEYIHRGLLFYDLDSLISSLESLFEIFANLRKGLKPKLTNFIRYWKIFIYELIELFPEEFSDFSGIDDQEFDRYWENTSKSIEKLEHDYSSSQREGFEFLIDIGNHFSSLHDYIRAIVFYSHAIKLKINVSDAYSKRSSALAAIGDYEGAQEDMEMAIKLMNL